MFHEILLAVDGSEHSMRAAQEAQKIAAFDSTASVTILYVADFEHAKYDVLHSSSSVDLDMTRRKRLQPVEQFFQENITAYKVEILHGTPGPTIVEFANKHHFDLLIIGSRGLNSLQEMVLGSVSHKVIKRAECPVLVVK
ncbi:universal stress protein [Paenisporosarcina cavernae]|uniref:Universal stress protein n=1 Tax=Paenisporosarcina cavernae TaxID=2320858 RepID=A0A385YY02_9BACL|nr:universal stress protein [Paenisporosarcina cavernae]AYC30488.1 universal stress protein [Paenisporosarcina cavernae]